MPAEQFIAQLDELAKVEHALCVEYLSVHCALGHDRDPGPDASAHEQAVPDAARAAMNLAMDEMRHLHGVNRALVAARGEAQVARAESVGGVTIGRLGAAELERLADREGAIAAAIDAIYQRLCAVLAAQPTLFQDPTLAEVSSLLDPCPDHSTPLAAVLHPLAEIPPSEYVARAAARPRPPERGGDSGGGQRTRVSRARPDPGHVVRARGRPVPDALDRDRDDGEPERVQRAPRRARGAASVRVRVKARRRWGQQLI
jgi:hypothetical protein